jgi:hypothetical protein
MLEGGSQFIESAEKPLLKVPSKYGMIHVIACFGWLTTLFETSWLQKANFWRKTKQNPVLG